MVGNDDPADEEETNMFVKDQGATASYRILARGRGGGWARTYDAQRRAAEKHVLDAEADGARAGERLRGGINPPRRVA